MITPRQSRAARALLGWSQSDLAEAANVSLSTIRDFELGKKQPIQNNQRIIREAIESAGVTLTERGGVEPGK